MNAICRIFCSEILNVFRDSYTLMAPYYFVASLMYVLGKIFELKILMIPALILITLYSFLSYLGVLYLLNGEKKILNIALGLSFFCEIQIMNYENIIINISILGMLSTLIFILIYISINRGVAKVNLKVYSMPPPVCKLLNEIISSTLIILSGLIVGLVWLKFSLFELLNTLIYYIAVSLDNIIVAILIVGAIGALWEKGINGTSYINTIFRPFLLLLAMSNLVVDSHYIITEQFFDLVWLGGSGATLGLVLVLKLSRGESDDNLKIIDSKAYMFNINENLIFGLPIYKNTILVVPFIIAPCTIAIFQYFLMNHGIVPTPNGIIIPWITPPVIAGILVTGSIRGGVMQIVSIIISALIYYPFLKQFNKKRLFVEINDK